MTASTGGPSGAALRVPALLWALLHTPIILLLYRTSFGIALGPLTGRYRLGMLAAWTLEAGFLCLVAFVIALPFSVSRRWYRWAAPAVTSAFILVLALDSALYEALAFHINALIVRVAFQPATLGQIGIPVGEFERYVAGLALFVTADIALGALFIPRFARRWRWSLLGLLLLLPVTDRLMVATMNFTGGRVVLAAGDVLPLQVPFRMNRFLGRLTGRSHDRIEEPLALAGARIAVQPLPPDSVNFTRRPDVVLVLIESLRADFLTPAVMPRLWQRAQSGARFEHHYASASSTHYALFSVFYAANAQKLESVVGGGASPLLFGAMRANGYQMRLITASSVDWMGLTKTVFRDAAEDLDTDIPGTGVARDSAMLARATRFVQHADARPIFLVLFFDGTHFNYAYRPRSRRFSPDWDGRGSIAAARVDPALMKRRAMNAAYEVDWELDDFLDAFARRRGRAPLSFITGDHGEAFREHGRVGHGAGVAEGEIHVPMVLLDDSVAPGVVTGVTSHVDIVPTLFHLLGDRHDPSSWSDGALMTSPPEGRFVISTAGWIPRFAVIGDSLKAQFFRMDAGLGGVTITGPGDEPIDDADARLRAQGPRILRALRSGR
jgi:hypothetical protein